MTSGGREIPAADTTPTVYQVPVKPGDEEPIRINFERTVLEGVPRGRLDDICDVPIDHETVRVWGNQADTAAEDGDYLLFADRDGHFGGDYTYLARIERATILDDETAAAFTDAVGWGEVSDDSYQHVMFLEPIYETTLDREEFWETVDYSGWPNNTFARIKFDRSGSRFFEEYDSVAAFIDEIRGEKIYPTESNGNESYPTTPIDEYETLEQAIADIRTRIDEATRDQSWLEARLGAALIAEWSTALAGFTPSGTVSRSTAATFDQLREIYESLESELEETANELGVGSHYSFSPAKTLFLCWVRIRQEELGDGGLLSQPRLNSILRETYTVEGETEPDGDHPVITHIRSTSPTVYAFNASPTYLLATLEYGSISFEEQYRDRWGDLSEGDVVVLHAQNEPTAETDSPRSSGVIGVGILGEAFEKDEPWWVSEHTDEASYPLVVTFDRLFLTGSIDEIDTSKPLPEKTPSRYEGDLVSLTRDSLSIERANRLCTASAGTEFPTRSTHAAFRSDDGSSDRDGPIALVEAMAESLTEVATVNVHESYRGSIPDDTLEGLYFPGDGGGRILEQITTALRSGKHVLLTGPPGTGKTEIARRVCETLVTEYPYLYSRFETTTATADWSTFDTVGGYMPDESDESGGDDLAFTPGIVLNRLKNTRTGTQSNELLVIDELNRADIDKAFGQLFTLLSGQSVQLPYTMDGHEVELTTTDELSEPPADHQYCVPESWRIFATMNTYDKTSLYEMSYAFMRRFAFIRVPAPDLPDDDGQLEDLVYEYANAWELDPDRTVAMAVGRVWRATNSAVEERAIGPAIIEDVLRYVDHHPESDLEYHLTQAVISYLFPQLEGVPKRRQIVREIAAVREIDESLLEGAAREMLQVSVAANE